MSGQDPYVFKLFEVKKELERSKKIRKKAGRRLLTVGIYNLAVVSIFIILFSVIGSIFIIDWLNRGDEDDGFLGPEFSRDVGSVFLGIALFLSTFAIVYVLLIVSGYFVLKDRHEKFSRVVSWTAIPFLFLSLGMNIAFMIFTGTEADDPYVLLLISAILIPIGLKIGSIVIVWRNLRNLKELRNAPEIIG